jgi:soluble lytic murein transglycosylase-like protein
MSALRTRITLRLLGAAALTAALVAALAVHQARAKTSHGPDAIRAMVVTEALDLGLPVALALAVAHAESNFNPRALSHKGARGVMQIMPATARGEYGVQAELLWQPRINIRIGIHFLRRLITRYHGRVDLALSYYNGGSAVGDLPRARVIPATRNYVKRVRSLHRSYRKEVWAGGFRKWTQKSPSGKPSRRD